jgi:tetratricopeptide (TPR) repeat protein
MTPLDADLDDTQSLEAALERNPNHTPILMRLAELALANGDAVTAVDHLRAILAQEPDNLEARLELGRALWEAGDQPGAEKETAAILEADPNNVDALYNLGAIHANQQRKEAAIEYWTRAVLVAPASPSGQSAQRGLDILGGRPTPIPDIPEHRNIRQGGSSTPPAQEGAPMPLDPVARQRIVEFASKSGK